METCYICTYSVYCIENYGKSASMSRCNDHFECIYITLSLIFQVETLTWLCTLFSGEIFLVSVDVQVTSTLINLSQFFSDYEPTGRGHADWFTILEIWSDLVRTLLRLRAFNQHQYRAECVRGCLYVCVSYYWLTHAEAYVLVTNRTRPVCNLRPIYYGR